MKKQFILLLTLFLLLGCSSKKRVVAPVKTLPSWYTNQIKSNTRTLYSVGEGESKSQAIANALNQMVSTLSVSISSDFSTHSEVREGTINSIQTDSVSNIHSQVEKLRVSNYQIINEEEFGFQRYLVAIKSDKMMLFSSLDKEISQEFDTIQRKYEESTQFNALKRVSMYKEAKESVRNLKYTLLVMNSLNQHFDDKAYLSKILEVENRYDSLLSQITFSIDSNHDGKELMPSIANGLSLAKYKMSKKSDDKNHFRIRIVASVSQAKSYGFDLARSAISIVVKDKQGIAVGSNKLNITGQSTQGYAIAKENVAVKLNAKIIRDGIEEIIGLDI